MPSFNQVLSPCAFNFWTSNPLFAADADNMVVFVLRKLGEDVLSVELTKKMIWTCFEEATREFNGMIIEYQFRSNLASILGTPTGSVDNTTGINNINLTNFYVKQNLQFLDRMSEPYASMIGYGTQDTYSGSIQLSMGTQDYDINTELKDNSGNTIWSLQPPGSGGKMSVYEVWHVMPIQYVFNSNLASNFVAQGMPVESYIPDTRFYVLPVFEDVLRAGMLKTAQKVRRSHYSYRVAGNKIRLYPTPSNLIPGYNDRLWIRVGFRGSILPQFDSTMYVSGTATNPVPSTDTKYDATIFGTSNPANAPYGTINYSSLNQWARNWIAQYTLALCKELLGLIRSKFKNFPIPGAELQLNGEELVSNGREDKKDLMTGLKDKLEALSYDKLQEIEANRAEAMAKQLQFVPIPPTYALRIF
jgi:hypothetical protein